MQLSLLEKMVKFLWFVNRDSQAEINQTQSSALEICDKFI